MFGSTPFVVVPKYTPNGDVPASVFPSVMEGILNVGLTSAGIYDIIRVYLKEIL